MLSHSFAMCNQQTAVLGKEHALHLLAGAGAEPVDAVAAAAEAAAHAGSVAVEYVDFEAVHAIQVTQHHAVASCLAGKE